MAASKASHCGGGASSCAIHEGKDGELQNSGLATPLQHAHASGQAKNWGLWHEGEEEGASGAGGASEAEVGSGEAPSLDVKQGRVYVVFLRLPLIALRYVVWDRS